MLKCLGKVPPDRSLFNVSDYIIQQHVHTRVDAYHTCDTLVQGYLYRVLETNPRGVIMDGQQATSYIKSKGNEMILICVGLCNLTY